jgi:hypothetical protein
VRGVLADLGVRLGRLTREYDGYMTAALLIWRNACQAPASLGLR